MEQVKKIMIKDIPISERPRERLLEYGSGGLSNIELVAILLRTGSKNESVIQLAQSVMSKLETLQAFHEITIEELTKIRGIGPAKAIQIIAGIELGKRVLQEVPKTKFSIKMPGDAVRYIEDDIKYLKQENFVILLLDTKNQIISKETISIGTLNSSIVHPREVFKPAIKKSVSAIILVHNHPSGDPTPSKEDIEVTKRLIKAGELIGIDILDHIIIGDSKYISFKEEGLM